MQMSNATYSALHESSSFVLCNDEVKLVKIDGNLENVNENIRYRRLVQDFKRFGQTVRQYFLDPRIIDWQRRDEFLKIFNFANIGYDRLTKMVNRHPFLMVSDHCRMKYFSEIWHTLSSTTLSQRVLYALGSRGLMHSTYVQQKTHGWFRPGMRKEFHAIFDFEGRDKDKAREAIAMLEPNQTNY